MMTKILGWAMRPTRISRIAVLPVCIVILFHPLQWEETLLIPWAPLLLMAIMEESGILYIFVYFHNSLHYTLILFMLCHIVLLHFIKIL